MFLFLLKFFRPCIPCPANGSDGLHRTITLITTPDMPAGDAFDQCLVCTNQRLSQQPCALELIVERGTSASKLLTIMLVISPDMPAEALINA